MEKRPLFIAASIALILGVLGVVLLDGGPITQPEKHASPAFDQNKVATVEGVAALPPVNETYQSLANLAVEGNRTVVKEALAPEVKEFKTAVDGLSQELSDKLEQALPDTAQNTAEAEQADNANPAPAVVTIRRASDADAAMAKIMADADALIAKVDSQHGLHTQQHTQQLLPDNPPEDPKLTELNSEMDTLDGDVGELLRSLQ